MEQYFNDNYQPVGHFKKGILRFLQDVKLSGDGKCVCGLYKSAGNMELRCIKNINGIWVVPTKKTIIAVVDNNKNEIRISTDGKRLVWVNVGSTQLKVTTFYLEDFYSGYIEGDTQTILTNFSDREDEPYSIEMNSDATTIIIAYGHIYKWEPNWDEGSSVKPEQIITYVNKDLSADIKRYVSISGNGETFAITRVRLGDYVDNFVKIYYTSNPDTVIETFVNPTKYPNETQFGRSVHLGEKGRSIVIGGIERVQIHYKKGNIWESLSSIFHNGKSVHITMDSKILVCAVSDSREAHIYRYNGMIGWEEYDSAVDVYDVNVSEDIDRIVYRTQAVNGARFHMRERRRINDTIIDIENTLMQKITQNEYSINEMDTVLDLLQNNVDTETKPSSNTNNTTIIIGTVVGGVVAIILFVLVYFYVEKKRKSK